MRVPVAAWGAVTSGCKREFRAQPGNASALWNVETPTPCAVAYKVAHLGRYSAALMVLEAVWREPLGAISEESLANEGYATMGDFRRAWVMREKRRFPLLAPVTVHRVRPWTPEDAGCDG